MSTLFRKDGHQLLEGSRRLADFEDYVDIVAVDQIRREWCVMERIKPVPALNSLIVVRVHPRQTFTIGFADAAGKIVLLLLGLGEKLLRIVAVTVALDTKLDFVNVCCDFLVVLGVTKALDFIFYSLCDEDIFFFF